MYTTISVFLLYLENNFYFYYIPGKWEYVGPGASQDEIFDDSKIFDDSEDGETRPKMPRRSRRIAMMRMEREKRGQSSNDNGDSASQPSDMISSAS